MAPACDGKVLADTSKEERGDYSEVLMSCIGTDRTGRLTLSTGYVQGAKFIKRRFRKPLAMMIRCCVLTVPGRGMAGS